MYIDTSCLVAFYMPEEFSSGVHKVITSSDSISVSSITTVEFFSALKKKMRIGFSSGKETEIAINKFDEHMTKGFFRHIEIEETHFSSAADLLLQTNTALRALDAIHLGISREEKIKIYSNDSTLLKAAKEYNIQTIEI